MKKPLIGFTMGDPGGIGPELVLRTLSEVDPHELNFQPVILGPTEALTHPLLEPLTHSLLLEFTDTPTYTKNRIPFIATPELGNAITIGEASDVNGHHMYNTLEKAIEFALKGQLDAIVTAPANKESLSLAGYSYTGHTTILKHLTNSANVRMGFYTQSLKTVLATVHVPLSTVPRLLTTECLADTLEKTLEFAQLCNIEKPRIGVAGLNPHAGENGLFGGEENCLIGPFVDSHQHPYYTLTGPHSADTLYHRAVEGEFDIVISLYHDQGLIPIKLMGFGEAVNVTLGLPFIRTSPDHGTAYDIAYQGIAKTTSMHAALHLSLNLVYQNALNNAA